MDDQKVFRPKPFDGDSLTFPSFDFAYLAVALSNEYFKLAFGAGDAPRSKFARRLRKRNL